MRESIADHSTNLPRRGSTGDMVFYTVLGTPILMVFSADIALELMDRRSSIYSDRPITVIDEM